MIKSKKCSKCHKTKGIDCFNREYCSVDGYNTWCRACVNKHHKQKDELDEDEVLRKREYRDKANRIKEQQGCSQCGEKDSICLEFHHLEPEFKVDTISNLIKHGYEWEVIETEIAKCDVLCANCHRKEHKVYIEAEYTNMIGA